MAGFTRIIHGSPVRFPGMFPGEVEQLNRIIDALEEDMAAHKVLLETALSQNAELMALLEADIDARAKREALAKVGAEVHRDEPTRSWWPFGRRAERR